MRGVVWSLTRLAAQVVLALAFAATAAADTAHGWPPFVDELGVALMLLALAGMVVGPTPKPAKV